jgi:hypothetical protein
VADIGRAISGALPNIVVDVGQSHWLAIANISGSGYDPPVLGTKSLGKSNRALIKF